MRHPDDEPAAAVFLPALIEQPRDRKVQARRSEPQARCGADGQRGLNWGDLAGKRRYAIVNDMRILVIDVGGTHIQVPCPDVDGALVAA